MLLETKCKYGMFDDVEMNVDIGIGIRTERRHPSPALL
jgi:hypothetical protein